MFIKYERIDPSPEIEYRVTDITIDSIVQVNDNVTKKEDMPNENGISPRCINSICEKYDISHYVFDISKKCFIKNISKNRNHKALIYFAVNNHMYLIVEDAVRKSLVKKTND